MISKKWLVGFLFILYVVPANSEPNKVVEYYQSIINVGYYYADISVFKPVCYVKHEVDNAKLENSKKSQLPSVESKKAESSNKIEDKKTVQRKINLSETQNAFNQNRVLPSNNLDHQEIIKVRVENQQHNLLEYSKNKKQYQDDFHFIIYKEWKLNNSNIFVKQLNEKNTDITVLKEFYLLNNNKAHYKHISISSNANNDNFAREFNFYNIAYLDFIYYFYNIQKIKENNKNIFFTATLKKDSNFTELPIILKLNPTVRIKFNKQYNLPVKFLYFNEANKPIGSITVTEIEAIGKIYYAVGYKIVNYHLYSKVKIENLLIGLSLDLESNSKLRLSEYKDLIK